MRKRKTYKRPVEPPTRKALRKQRRVEKKVKKQEHYSKKSITKTNAGSGCFVKRPESTQKDENIKKKNIKLAPTAHEILQKDRQKDLKITNKLKSEMDKQRREILLQANENEEKVIRKLEKQLGLNKSKNKNNFFSEDGLDYLLEICDKTTSEQIVAAEKHLADIDDATDDEDLSEPEESNRVSGKGVNNKSGKKTKVSKNENITKPDDMSDEDNSDNSEALTDDSDMGSDESEQEDLLYEEGGDDSENDDDSDDDEQEFEDNLDNISEAEEEPPKKKSKIANKTQQDTSNRNSSKVNKNNPDPEESDDQIANPFSDDEVSHLSDDDSESDGDDGVVDDDTKKPDVWEDIYGRKRDKEGNIVKEEKGVYIPPHLRNKDATTDKDMVLIRRQIKSVLNKLTGSNLHWACNSIESVYTSYSRHSVKTALSDEWIAAMVSPSVTPERFIIEHAALLAVLHANVATEIGAHFLQVLANMFDDMLQKPEHLSDKKLDNLVACLAHLYSFKIYHANLLYDILTRLLVDLTEKNIGSVIVALRCVGGVMRKDEPLALKGFIQEAQKKVQGLNDSCDTGSRMKFLLEILMAIKNNNLNKIPNYDPTYSEQMKKTLKGIIRKGSYITPLNITLEDLLKADERGKWWVVGSAWEGTRVLPETKRESNPIPAADQKLLDLARKQRMNTDVRRSIFCVIMSAEDYMDAFEKLQHLGLKGQQEREIIHVLLACCLQEKSYNPYYAVLGRKLCDTDRKYQLSIQYSVWDKIKDLENLTKQTINNLAQFLTHLFMEKSLPLSVLKVIQFSDLNKATVKFMRQILLSIIMSDDQQSSIEVFNRIATSPKLHMFRESLRLFIQHFLVKNGQKSVRDDDIQVLKERSVQIDKILTMHDSKLRF